jgi:hypothetical protein
MPQSVGWYILAAIMKFSRRTAMEIIGAVALTPAAESPLAAAQVPAAPKEGNDTPKIAVGMGDGGGFAGGGLGAASTAAVRAVSNRSV